MKYQKTPLSNALHRQQYVIDEALRYPIPIVTLSNTLQHNTADVMELVGGNGAWGGPHSFSRLARCFLRAADSQGRKAAFTLYGDPWFGKKGCVEADRSERLERVIIGRARAANRPVHLLAHSWSAKGAIEVAHRAYKQQQVVTFLGYTIAHRAIGDTQSSLRRLATGGLQEMMAGGGIAGLGSVATIGATTLNAFIHGTTALPSALRAVYSACNVDLTAELVGLSQTMQSGLLLAGCDTLFGPAQDQKQHLETAGFKGPIEIMDGVTHSAAVSNYRNGQTLYRFAVRVFNTDPFGS